MHIAVILIVSEKLNSLENYVKESLGRQLYLTHPPEDTQGTHAEAPFLTLTHKVIIIENYVAHAYNKQNELKQSKAFTLSLTYMHTHI